MERQTNDVLLEVSVIISTEDEVDQRMSKHAVNKPGTVLKPHEF